MTEQNNSIDDYEDNSIIGGLQRDMEKMRQGFLDALEF